MPAITMAAAECSGDVNVVSEAALKRLAREFDLESIFYLDLSDRGLSDHTLGALPLCSSLCILHLSMNALTSTAPLQTLTQLQELDLSANHISSLEGSDQLVALRKLHLAGNQINHQHTLLVLSRLALLKDLSLQLPGTDLTNPVCSSAGYSQFMRENFLGLVWLDGEKICGPGAELYTSAHPTSTQQQESESDLAAMVTTHAPLPDHLADFSLGSDEDTVTKLVAECTEYSDTVQQHIASLKKELAYDTS